MFVASVSEDGFFLIFQNKQNQIQFHSWNITSRAMPDKVTLELINYCHFLQIKKTN